MLAAMIGTLLDKLDGADKEIVNQGLFGFNSVLTGMTLYLFLTGPFHWILSLIGALLDACYEKDEHPSSNIPFYYINFVYLAPFLSIKCSPYE